MALGLGTFLGLRAGSKYDESEPHCPGGSGTCDTQGVELGNDARGLATASTIGFVAGGGLLAGGLVLFFTAPRSKGTSSGRAIKLRPTASASGAGMIFGGAW